MSSRNRVTPTGDIVAISLRGAWTGNRGIIHVGADITRFHAGAAWITCALEFRSRWQPQWQPHHYTVLFFHDEAVSLAAGHRPCAECRRSSYTAFRKAWAVGHGVDPPPAPSMDGQLHAERLVRGTHRRRLHPGAWPALPVGSFVLVAGAPHLVLDDHLTEWTTQGYSTRRSRPRSGTADVLTPPAVVAALKAGYEPQIDRTARE